VGGLPTNLIHPVSRLGIFALGSFLFLASCGDGDPTGLDTSRLEVVVVKGDGQAAEPESLLPTAFQVRVRTIGNGAPVEGAEVLWEVLEGSGATLDPAVSETNNLGLTATTLTLGPELGIYRVQARVRGTESPPVEFAARAVRMPSLDQLPAGSVSAGDTILLGGANFSSFPDDNVVTFSRIRGRVVSSTESELRVEVPPCLLEREYHLQVRIGSLSTSVASIQVEGSAGYLDLERGGDLVLDLSEGLGCFQLPAEPGSLYLVVPHSTSTVGAGAHDYSLVGLTSDGASPSPMAGSPVSVESIGLSATGSQASGYQIPVHWPTLEAQDRWDERLRLLEAELLAQPSPIPSSSSGGPGPSLIPAVGDQREFHVLAADERFEKVKASLRYVSDHVLVYLDEDVPAGGFTDEDLAAMASEFEDPVYPVLTGAFGSESDLDGNGRVIILFTAAVNRLTESGSESFVGGFFYGLDLLRGRSGSNGGEIFYSVVPDPNGAEGPAIGKYTALSTIPAVLAHEFEHMIHFNQRILVKEAVIPEALWLSEALAQMAEDLVGTAFDEAQRPTKAYQYRVGNWIRARKFLQNTSQVSVLASLPPGTLAERGAGWLILKQVLGRSGGEDLLFGLASSTATGVDNLSGALGLDWEEILADWVGSLYLDGTNVPVRPELLVQGVNLRASLSESDGSYPLRAQLFGEESAYLEGTLWSSAPDYFIISPPAGGVAVGAGGPLGGAPEATLGLQVLLVRLL
jgi:hypothetical protein